MKIVLLEANEPGVKSLAMHWVWEIPSRSKASLADMAHLRLNVCI